MPSVHLVREAKCVTRSSARPKLADKYLQNGGLTELRRERDNETPREGGRRKRREGAERALAPVKATPPHFHLGSYQMAFTFIRASDKRD